VLLRAYESIWYMTTTEQKEIFPFLMPETLTFFMGLDLCWIITELSLRIRFSLKVGNSVSMRRQLRVKSPERCIKVFRIGCTIFTGVSCVILASAMLVVGHFDDKSRRANFEKKGLQIYGVVLQAVASVLLTTSIVVLESYMKKQKELTGDTSVFRQERRTFFLVLWLFDISYLLRAIYSQVFFFDQIENFTALVLDLFIGILFDLIPLSMILYIHRRNFKTIKNERVAARNA